MKIFLNVSNHLISTNSDQDESKCFGLKLIAYYLIFLFIFGSLINGVLLYIFCTNKKLRIPLNIFVIALTVCNLIGVLTELPPVILTNLKCRWLYGDIGCKITGFIMYFVGCAGIFLIAAISFERYYIIYNPLSFRQVRVKTICMAIFACLFFAFLWAVLPLFGWSRYSLEGVGTSCSVEWKEKSLNVLSYNISMFLIVFLVPLILILYTNIKLLALIRSMRKFNQEHCFNSLLKKKLKVERNLTLNMMILVCGFLTSWIPYSFVSMYSAFINADHIGPFASTIPSMLAKSSIVWPTMFYMLSNKIIKRILFQMFKLNRDLPVTIDSSNDRSLNRSLKTLNQINIKFCRNGRPPILL